jgi:hypothetical protein
MPMGRHGAGWSGGIRKPSPFVALPVLALLVLSFAASMAPADGPVLQLSSHHDGQTVHSGDIILSGIASSPVGIASINVSLNAGPWEQAAGNESWSIPLHLMEGANIIMVNATDLEANSTQQTVLIAYTITASDNSGVILAAAVVAVIIALMVIVALRLKPAPPPPENGAEEDVEARLKRIRDKGDAPAERGDGTKGATSHGEEETGPTEER